MKDDEEFNLGQLLLPVGKDRQGMESIFLRVLRGIRAFGICFG